MSVAEDHMQFDNICRTCLSAEQNMKSIFDIDCSLGDTLQLFEMLMACTSVQVQEDDGLPAQICLSCINCLARSFTFKKVCEDSDATLREVLRKSTIIDSKPSIALKPSSDVALCAQETVTDIDPNLLDIKMEFEEGETKIGDLLISDNEYTACEEDIKMMISAEEDLASQTIKPNGFVNPDDGMADLKGGSAFKVLSDINQQSPLKCQVCGKECGGLNVLTRHMKEMHGDAKSFRCHQCGRGFTCWRNLTCHLQAHTEANPFVCKLCDKRFAQPHELLAHERVHANQKKDLICAECGRGFSHITAFTFHQKTHLRTKKHVCNICGRHIARKSWWLAHMKHHEGVKKHACPRCHKAFTTAAYLKIHERFHTGEKRFICEVCGKGYVTKSQLKQHMPVHTRLRERLAKCHLCKKKFSHRDLQEHLGSHPDHKQHTLICEYCQKGFYHFSKLKVHLRTHTGEKPHTCTICNKSFARSGNLRAHWKTH